MTNRPIPCPECGGDGYLPEDYKCDNPCRTCGGAGEIPDRRTLTAAERAVERIKAYAAKVMDENGDWSDECFNCCENVMNIIREEEGR